LQVLQDRGVIPQLLEPGDVQEVLQQLLVTLPDQVRAGVVARMRCGQSLSAQHTIPMSLTQLCLCVLYLLVACQRRVVGLCCELRVQQSQVAGRATYGCAPPLLLSCLWLQDTLFTSLDCSQFSQALSMCGLAAFAARRMQQHGSHMQAPEQQLAAFLKLIGLKALPGQQLQLRSGPNPLGPAPTYAGGATAGPAAATHSGNAGAGPLVSKHSSNGEQLALESMCFELCCSRTTPCRQSCKAGQQASNVRRLLVAVQQ
jgi:hypothetical protein